MSDLISRDELAEKLKTIIDEGEHRPFIFLDELIEFISDNEATPTVDAEPVRHGRWEKVTYQNSRGELWQGRTCNRCVESGFEHGYILAIGEPNQNYCPNCGAKMDGGGNAGDKP